MCKSARCRKVLKVLTLQLLVSYTFRSRSDNDGSNDVNALVDIKTEQINTKADTAVFVVSRFNEIRE